MCIICNFSNFFRTIANSFFFLLLLLLMYINIGLYSLQINEKQNFSLHGT